MSSAARRRLLMLAITALVVIAVVVVYLLTRGGTEQTATVTRGSIQVTIQTVGRLAVKDPVAVRSGVSGSVKLLAVQVGDSVKAGDVVAVLDPAPYQQALNQAEQEETDAETALNVLEQGLPPNPNADQTAQRLAAVQKVDEAKAAVKTAQDNLAATLVLAPADGTIMSVPVSAGSQVPSGAEIAQEADLSNLQLNVDLDEVDFPNVTTGMNASIRLDAYPANEITGTIQRISPVAQTSGGTTTFPLTIGFSPPAGVALRPGMNASVSIQSKVRDNVLLVPQQALQTVGDRTFVTVVSNGHHEEREIRVGLSSGGKTEVASGLSEGEKVVLH